MTELVGDAAGEVAEPRVAMVACVAGGRDAGRSPVRCRVDVSAAMAMTEMGRPQLPPQWSSFHSNTWKCYCTWFSLVLLGSCQHGGPRPCMQAGAAAFISSRPPTGLNPLMPASTSLK